MKNLHDYFYAFSAACFLAIGTGFMSFVDKQLEYDKSTYEAVSNLEKISGVKVTKTTDCEKLIENKSGCNYAVHLLKTNQAVVRLYDVAGKLLVFFTISSFSVGVIFQYRLLIKS